MKNQYQLVGLPTRVPKGKFCWRWTAGIEVICPSFRLANETTPATCTQGFETPGPTEGTEGYVKPIACQRLPRWSPGS